MYPQNLSYCFGNRKKPGCIFCAMEKEEKNIFYMEIEEGAWGKKRELLAHGLPIRKVGRSFPYLFWNRRAVTGSLQIYFTFLPEYEKKLWGKHSWKSEMAEKLLANAAAKANGAYGCREELLGPRLGRRDEELPMELWAVCLYRQRPFDRICISLPEEGENMVWQTLELLRPYLPKMRRASFFGGESENGRMLKDVIAEEFGLVLTDGGKPGADTVWLDFRWEEGQNSGNAKASPPGKCVNRNLVWNFLDTTVKNGYNTKVN